MKSVLISALFALVVVSGMSGPSLAVEPDEILDDPVLEQRARELSKGLRCLVCQNQSIDDSNAELARDLRIIVRERLTAGDSDEETMDYIVARYGDYVLLKPPVNAGTLGLWLGPFLILIVAGIAVFFFLRGRSQAFATQGAGAESTDTGRALDAAETARLNALLGEDADKTNSKKDSS